MRRGGGIRARVHGPIIHPPASGRRAGATTVRFSALGRRLTHEAGISLLMDDLGAALAGRRDMCMLGGGNPGHIPAVAELFRQRMLAIAGDPEQFAQLVGSYDPPLGQPRFAHALAALLRGEFGWDVGAEHIAVTNGSQSASFMLFNLLAGHGEDGVRRHIELPLTPEYIGYADQGVDDGLFRAARPEIEHLDEVLFKYRVDFDALDFGNDVAAVCASRPTNPTGNVLTDDEVRQLAARARAAGVPLILDNAYGLPFPGIVFGEASPYWDENTVLLMSLSKIGLPGVRTGIVVADPRIVRALGALNSVFNLTTGGLGQALATELVESREIISVGRQLVRPFYRSKAARAVDQLRRELSGHDLHIHRPEGAIFLWLWLRGLPITSAELYQRLKRRGVLVLSGHYFFPGLEGPWRHRDECLRVNYAQDDAMVERGISILAEEVRRAYDEGG